MTIPNGTTLRRENSPSADCAPSWRSFTAILSVAMAYGGILWLTLIHHFSGATEVGAPPLLFHWLRDGTAALPLVFAAVLVTVWVARDRGLTAAPTRGLHLVFWACAAALLASVAVALGQPLHEAFFGPAATGVHAHGLATSEPPRAAHMLRDGLIGLGANLPAALLASAVLVLPLRYGPRTSGTTAPTVMMRAIPRTTPRQRARVIGGLAGLVLLLASELSPWGGIVGHAQAAELSPCPAGAPMRTFRVQAINVNIPLNRFGDHDPDGRMYVLASKVPAVREQEAAQTVSIGLADDPIQPLVIRANEGDCVTIEFTNLASGGRFGIHIDGLAYRADSSGDAVGRNADSGVANGASKTYQYYVPNDPRLEGVHYLHPGPGYRKQVAHGLFGALVVEPPGSTYLDPRVAGRTVESGWEATIAPAGAAAFRENVKIFHEVGDESEKVYNSRGNALPTIDPHTAAYRPGSRALNYRSEPFMNRLDLEPSQKSLAYNSYTFGDPATPMPRGYLGDPTKFRILHAGSEVFHVYHLHGGGVRWRANPQADTTYSYAATGLDKHPKTEVAPSARLDSQSMGPSEAFDLEIEGGAGGVQQAVGDLLFHCHIAHHYNSGMWSIWRIFNTAQPDLQPLPDRLPMPRAVTSAQLIGRTFNGTTLTAATLDAWIRPQLPPPGVPASRHDASVWNWTIDRSNPAAPLYLGEPEDTSSWPDLPRALPGHPGLLLGDELVGTRPKLLFDPSTGRPAYPLLRPHTGQRSPFAGDGHSGAPYLGMRADQPAAAAVDPWANRADGICPANATSRKFTIVDIEVPIQVTRKGATDETGMIFVLAKDKEEVRARRKTAEPLAIRGNIGDCIDVTFTTELTDRNAFGGFAKSNIHIHHVQFDPQGSDGASAGFVYDQSVRPYTLVDPTLKATAARGSSRLQLESVAKFQPGVWIGVGLGRDGMEVRQIATVNARDASVTLTQPLEASHAAGEYAGTEFMRYRWYPDVQLDNVFWHDHVDGIHGWSKGLVGQFIVEPRGSTYHDPVTGAQVESGTAVDIHTTNALVPGVVDGSFREVALWTIDENPVTDSTINLRAEPLSDRGGNAADRFSSYKHGDPYTLLPRAYVGDPLVIRTVNVSGGVDTLHLDGHQVYVENRYTDYHGVESSPLDTIHYGVSERYTLVLAGGAGGVERAPGDYLYMNGVARRTQQGAWGIIRVLPSRASDLQPLPDRVPPSGAYQAPAASGSSPPPATDAGNPCPAGAPERVFNVSAVDVPGSVDGRRQAFVPDAEVAAVQARTLQPDPLVLHAAAGECLKVHFTNRTGNDRASFHVAKLARTVESSGVNVGYNPEQTVGRGQSRDYRFFASSAKLGLAVVSDFGKSTSGRDGLYGAVVIAPPGAWFTDPRTGLVRDTGSQVVVHVPGASSYRDFTLALADRDPIIGSDHMPYPVTVSGPAQINYRSAPASRSGPGSFSSIALGADPATPLLVSYAGEPVRVHVYVSPGSEQMHAFSMGGHVWPIDPAIANSEVVSSSALGPLESLDVELIGGAGGAIGAAGDYFYGDLRRPFTEAGMWGLMRVLPLAGPECPVLRVDGVVCRAA